MAEPFQHISGVAIKVLARIAARKAVVEQLRANGIRRPVPHREIVRATNAYLANNPQLYEQAMATAWAMAAKDQQGRINAALFDDDRRGWRARMVDVGEGASGATSLLHNVISFFTATVAKSGSDAKCCI